MATAPSGYRNVLGSGFWVDANGFGPYVLDQNGVPQLALGGGNSQKTAFFNAVDVSTQVDLITPVAGKILQIVGYTLTSGVIAGNIILKFTAVQCLLLPFGIIGQSLRDNVTLDSGVVNARLNAVGTATQTLSGYISYNEY